MVNKVVPKSPPSPMKVEIEITNRCNQHCDYCSFYSSGSEVDRELTTEEWLTVFDELDRAKVMSVTLSGGEPFMRRDLPELIRGMKERRLRFNILSNGTLFREDWIRQIAETNRCNGIQVSIDGHNASVHDWHRGRGNFDKAVQGIRLLQKYKIPVHVRCTINRHNYSHLPSIAHFLLEELQLSSFSTNEVSFAGLVRENSEELCLGISEKVEAMDLLAKLTIQYPERIQANAGPLANARVWSELEREKQPDVKADTSSNTLTGCGCIFNQLAIRADGTIVPCSLLDLPLGNVKTDRIDYIFANHQEIIRLRERRQIELNRFAECRLCEFKENCTGGCPAMAYNTLGTDEHPDPDSCYRMFLNQGGRLPESVFQI